ncbi:hypothetical protein HQ447_01595 [bacterium]|nr:hypothetical protein [bacterium]
MIPYSRDPQLTLPPTAVKIIGLGGAGANMLERIALDGMEGAELLALNTDLRTLDRSLTGDKIQLGVNLTKGLGAGGDPDLGHQAALEAEEQIRTAIRGRRIVFLCTGLGGGTGSGAAPIITRIAREEGAFVVVFATMPFAFEGKRRREQAESSLNELAVLSNALVTFDNNRMGELVLAKQGIHEAFGAADHMVCESIKAVIRLVVRPGLINIGLDDLMSALRTNRSRCLFGSGIAAGKDRAVKALRNALNSPLLDQGTLLKDAQTVLVHLSGGQDLTLFEIELLMQRLQKFVPDKAHVLFGAAIDPAMGDSLSITLISALPEDSLAIAPRDSLSALSREGSILDPSQGFTPPPAEKQAEPAPEMASLPVSYEPRDSASDSGPSVSSLFDSQRPFAEPNDAFADLEPASVSEHPAFSFTSSVVPKQDAIPAEPEPAIEEEIPAGLVAAAEPMAEVVYSASDELDPEPIEDTESDDSLADESPAPSFTPGPKRRASAVSPWGRNKTAADSDQQPELGELEPIPVAAATPPAAETAAPELAEVEPPKLKLGIKVAGAQNELSLDSAPRGRFEGEIPNVFEGEDLDLPPFLRKKN